MARKGKQKPQQQAEYMNKLIEEWRGSGQSQEQFSISKGLSPKTFGYWLRKQRKVGADPGAGKRSKRQKPRGIFLGLPCTGNHEVHPSTEKILYP